jgi:hypothetical protein
MKTMFLVLWCSVLLASLSPLTTIAAEQPVVDRVTFKSGKVLAPVEGKLTETTTDVSLANSVVVKTNGVFTVGKGKARQLREGQTIDAQGMLTSPDGSVVPVFDHIVRRGGQVQISTDGEAKPLTGEYRLPDGSKVLADGSLRTADGRLQRLLDGQLLKLDGSAVASTDTISMTGGKVVLFKDGGRVELRRGQLMVMSDGTRVTGDGAVAKPDGTKVTLKEGDTLKVPGVIAPRR